MSKESRNVAVSDVEGNGRDELERYQGSIEWHKYADGRGRTYRFGLLELTDRAGREFLGGCHGRYRLVVLFDGSNIGQAYAFKLGNGGDNDYLSPDYVEEKLGRALYLRQDALTFTGKLAEILGRPTRNGHK